MKHINLRWILGGLLAIILYLAPFVQTEWAVNGYPWNHESQCHPGMVLYGWVSYGSLGNAYPNPDPSYYLYIAHDKGTFEIISVTEYQYQQGHIGLNRWSCDKPRVFMGDI